MSHKRILSQMFDVRPVAKTGDLDWEKIGRASETIKIEPQDYVPDKRKFEPKRKTVEILEFENLKPREKKSWLAENEQNLSKKIEKLSTKEEAKGYWKFQSPAAKKPAAVFFGTGEDMNFIRGDKLEEGSDQAASRKEKRTFLENPPVKRIIHPEKKEKAINIQNEPVVMPDELREESIASAEEKTADEKIEESPVVFNDAPEEKKIFTAELKSLAFELADQPAEPFPEEDLRVKEEDDFLKKFRFADIFLPVKEIWNFSLKRNALAFAGSALAVLLIIAIVPLVKFGREKKHDVLGVTSEGVENMEAAVSSFKSGDFEASGFNFSLAGKNFREASDNLGVFSSFVGDLAGYLPFASRLSSGKNAIEAGEHLAKAGEGLAGAVKAIDKIENPFSEKEQVSLLDIFFHSEAGLKAALPELIAAREAMEKINIEDLPAEKRERFLEIKNNLPEMISFVENFVSNSDIFVEILGGNGPRKYLFLFQNNQEMRATGGFIGSYGVLDIKDGRVRNFFIDGIFNPGGQLFEKIVPPEPIQKISAAWSLHDSNWWPDFPKSAKKAVSFYEKTGGPTVDGIIAITPEVMQEFLKITGPVEMGEYDITLDSNNFVSATQYQVEVNYDKEENRPKKILSDLAPIVLDRIFNTRDLDTIGKSAEAVFQALAKKQIILYSENEKIEEMISARGWSGKVLPASGDYLMVVNSNINGYKTDGVIEEEIKHEVEIVADGSVIDTLTVTRHHSGGGSDYEWWNKVNANYMRIYVPSGSRLLEIEGQTREFTDPPLDYQALGFKRDVDVVNEEKNMQIDEEKGVRVYEDSGKTVFAHWAYVSPGETVRIKYKYQLPFKINPRAKVSEESYSIVYQKQLGSKGSKLISTVKYPENLKIAWQFPENMNSGNAINYESVLETDKFVGAVFTRE